MMINEIYYEDNGKISQPGKMYRSEWTITRKQSHCSLGGAEADCPLLNVLKIHEAAPLVIIFLRLLAN